MPKLTNRSLSAFTLLESLLTLSVISFITLMINGSVTHIFKDMESKLFLMTFEQVYRETQRLSASQQIPQVLQIKHDKISNSLGCYAIPESIKPSKELTITFNEAGGNSSLESLSFQTPTETVTYQLHLGSGQYQKKRR